MGTCHSSSEDPQKLMLSPDQNPNLYTGSVNPSKTQRLSFNPKLLSKEDLFIKNSEVIHKIYKLFSPPIGKGSFGEVRKAMHLKSGQMRAIKVIKLDELGKVDRKSMLSEINILLTLNHPNIVKTYEYFDNGNTVFIVMELIEGEALIEYIVKNFKTLTETMIANIMYQLLSALNFLHINGIVHRDIKSGNLIYNGKVLTVIDFGMSKAISDKKGFQEIEGTALYMAPEILKLKGDEKVDIWASGVVLYALVVGDFPFKGNSIKEIHENIQFLKYSIPIKDIPNTSPELLSLLSALLEPNPKLRISASEALGHLFFKSARSNADKKSYGNVLNNLENFVFKNKLETAIYVFFSDEFTAQNEEEELIQAFNETDQDKDGVLSRTEFRLALLKSGRLYSEDEINRMFDRIDTDGSGTISFDEYKAASIDRQKFISQENIEKVFKMFDMVVLLGRQRENFC